jgi:PBSX family phage terminase large subunit
MGDAFDLSAKQERSIREASARVNLWHGSVRSGKTIGSLVRWLLFIAAVRDQSGDLVMFGRTRDSVWRNCIGPLQDASLFGDMAAMVSGNYGAPTVSILGRRVYVMGAHDVQAEKVLRGLTVLGAYGDEVTTVPEGFFLQMLARMSTPMSRLFGTTNPEGPKHWLKVLIDREMPDWRVEHFTLDDNPSLTKGYVESIKREYVGLWYQRFILGRWVQADGAIYDMWDESEHVVDASSLPELVRFPAFGIDYGTNHPTRGYLLGVARQPEPCLYVVAEWAPTIKTDAGYSADLRAWMASQPHPEWIYCDPAAASFKLQLFQDGLSNVADASNSVLDGIRTVASMLATGRLKISSACRELINEIPGYVWDSKAVERGIDAPVKLNDDSCDAMRYAVFSSRFAWLPYFPSIPTEGVA